MTASQTAIAAHRGGSLLWPENSFTAFNGAARLPVEFIEFDVHVSADDQLVVHHDANLDRMTNQSGAIMALDWADIARATITGTNDERPPLLHEVIDIFAPTAINLRLEIKLNAVASPYPEIEAKVAEALAAKGMLDRTVISAFSLDTLARFRDVATPGLGFIWLINPMTLRHIGGIKSAIKLAGAYDIPEIAPRAPDMSAALVATAKAAGLRVGAYAVNDPETIQRMLDLCIVAFTSDRPDLALAARERAA
jgi:glycerophosphoryl diester phosphodiesterase